MQIVCKFVFYLTRMKTSTSIILDTRKQKKNSTFPIKLRITHNREQRYYPTHYSLTREDYGKIRAGRPKGALKDIALDLHGIERKAIETIESLVFFSWTSFEKKYYSNRTLRSTIAEAFIGYTTELRVQGRIGTAVSYECASRSLNKFMPNLRFIDITPEILRNYEQWMLNNENSMTTVGIYIRALRTIVNSAISDGGIPKEMYPFGKRKYEIPTGSNFKKALSLADIALIFSYKFKEDSNRLACRDYWIFMYLCYGINVKDMCLLKFENIKGQFIEFERAKTARTKRTSEKIRIPISDEIWKIIKTRGNTQQNEQTYIFPILKYGLTAQKQRQLIQQLTHVINDNMKVIAKDLGIAQSITTYAARHSFATVLQRSGVSTDFIREALGHSNVKTTQNYLAGFEDRQRTDVVKALIAFDTNSI